MRLEHVINNTSGILYRFGGDEFIIYLPNTDSEGAIILAEKVRKTMESHSISSSRGNLHVTVSIGLVSVQDSAEISGSPENFFEELLAQADIALYKAKANGRNCVAFAEGKSAGML